MRRPRLERAGAGADGRPSRRGVVHPAAPERPRHDRGDDTRDPPGGGGRISPVRHARPGTQPRVRCPGRGQGPDRKLASIASAAPDPLRRPCAAQGAGGHCRPRRRAAGHRGNAPGDRGSGVRAPPGCAPPIRGRTAAGGTPLLPSTGAIGASRDPSGVAGRRPAPVAAAVRMPS
jgi:hypothetical protein